jgi:hypothetical protein
MEAALTFVAVAHSIFSSQGNVARCLEPRVLPASSVSPLVLMRMILIDGWFTPNFLEEEWQLK